eukprot:788720_1
MWIIVHCKHNDSVVQSEYRSTCIGLHHLYHHLDQYPLVLQFHYYLDHGVNYWWWIAYHSCQVFAAANGKAYCIAKRDDLRLIFFKTRILWTSSSWFDAQEFF